MIPAVIIAHPRERERERCQCTYANTIGRGVAWNPFYSALPTWCLDWRRLFEGRNRLMFPFTLAITRP